MRRLLLTSTLAAFALAATPALSADLDVMNFPPPFSPIPSVSESYTPVLTEPVRLVPERPRGAVPVVAGSAMIEDEAMLDYRPLELLRPPSSRITAVGPTARAAPAPMSTVEQAALVAVPAG